MREKKHFKVLFKVTGFVIASLFCVVFLRHFYLQNFIKEHTLKSQGLQQVFELKYVSKIRELEDLLELRYHNEFNSAKISVKYDDKPYILDIGRTQGSYMSQAALDIKKTKIPNQSHTSLIYGNGKLVSPYFYITQPAWGEDNQWVYYQVDFHRFIDELLKDILFSQDHYLSLFNDQGKLIYSSDKTNPAASIHNLGLNPFQQLYSTTSPNLHSILIYFNAEASYSEFETLSIPFLFLFLFILGLGSFVIVKFHNFDNQVKLQKRFNQDFNEIFRILIKELDSSVVIANSNTVLFCNQKTRIHLQDYESNSFIIPNESHHESFPVEIEHQPLSVFQKAVSFNNEKFTLQLVTNVSKRPLLPQFKGVQWQTAEMKADSKIKLIDKISQNLRIPLNSLLGMTVFLRESDLEPEQKENVQIIEDMGFLMNDILDDLIDISDLGAGHSKSKLHNVDIRNLIQNIYSYHHPKIDYRDLQFEIIVKDDVPSAVVSDKPKIRQILNQLLENAFEHTQKGKVTLSVSQTPEGSTRFLVEDTGPGLSEEELNSIRLKLDSFDQSSKFKVLKSGISLDVLQYYCQLLRSTLQVESKLGEGTRVYFDLKPSKEDGASMVDIIADPNIAGTIVDPAHAKILLVEDNKINIKITKKLLDQLSIGQVVTAENGRDAIDKIKDTTFDLILMDCNMPVMDGYKATQQLREQGIKTPVIALTASVSEANIDQCLACGMNHHLAKPIQLNSLKESLIKYLN